MRVVSIHVFIVVLRAWVAQVQANYLYTHDSQVRLRSSKYTAHDAYFIETTASDCVLPAEAIITPEQCDEAAEVLGLVLGYRGNWNLGGHCAKWAVLNMDTWYYHYASGRPGAQPICKVPAFSLGHERYCSKTRSTAAPECPAFHAEITSPSDCDSAASELGLTLHPSDGNVNYGGTCSQWHNGNGQENWYFYYASNQCGAYPICQLQQFVLSDPCPPGFESITVAAVCDIAGAALGLSPGFVTQYGFGGKCAKYELGGQSNVYYHWASNQPGATSICSAVTSNPVIVPTPSPTESSTAPSCTQLATGGRSNDWSTICKNVPTTAGHVQLNMGDVVDYFRPVAGATFCDMLTSSNQHEWSNNLTTWYTPGYYSAHFGGSALNWPLDNVAGDERRFLSFWDDGGGGVGGCCHNSYSDSSYPGRPFIMYWCQPGANLVPTPLPTSSGDITATGDPHLKNVFGERFDLMMPGRHVLINIPRGEPAEKAQLHVEADASRLGGQCEDLYFQELNITGSMAEEVQTGGYRFQARGDNETPEWLSFGKIQLKVVHGRTDHGIEYLNFYVKHLKRAGLPVGGLLGEDDHSHVEKPPEDCIQHVTM
ncbi:unnamed protein product [Prorocentrum cordatum]|uniref:Uncharacterized protein n=1 Tax=Prorocentrum cordatum TaxID=2364126 RepID=A0ABN9YIW2_9DINO|nr:unnamed protein product [Polarella glacialis]